MAPKISIRSYQEDDAQALANIYFYTIHLINIKDYTKEQVDVWAPESSLEAENWSKKFAKTNPIVAVVGETIVGFVEFEPNGHIDCFFCHHEWIGKGVGSALMNEIIKKAKNLKIERVFSEVSITAKPFFEKFGFKVLAEHFMERNGIKLLGYIMEKRLSKRAKNDSF